MEPHVYESGSGLVGSVSAEPVASSNGPGRRRDSWSLKTIVEEVGGRPIAEFQDPARPTHPYLKGRIEAAARSSRDPAEAPTDPIVRVYPPLVGATGRSLHGRDAEHDAETLASVASEPVQSVGHPNRPPGPSHRPERIYLHYLLLHLDRLNDAALAYLSQAVVEEMRERAAGEGAGASRTVPPRPESGGSPDDGADAHRARPTVQT
jgi:hypothetical protein